ncbi:NAD(P)-dependent oxidoreductase [Weissella soli]|uniref:NAD(P)-dependent oxidoreductase n=1 Tax=Weissella soli TaxID=155866 RepID=UPI0011BB885A|nr:NAD(P)-dependent oxidoreductase [Weissella soli]QEA35443.1 D-2-hydroxyacid dehydrogenase [Weissella soli]
MKIKLYSVRPDEQVAIDKYATTHPGIELITTTDEFHPDNVTSAQGVDAIVIQQRSAVGGDAKFYETLAGFGLKQITTRTAGLKVSNVPAYSPRSVAEFALMQIFRLLRHTPEFDANIAQQNYTWDGLQSREIHSVTVGIIGAGRIGGTLANLLHALGARVLAYDVKPRVEVAYVAEYVTLPELLAQSDVISLHVDLNPTSEGLISAAVLQQMKPGMLLVNASRGPVIDTKALFKALDDGIVAAAALDTIEGEGPVFAKDLSGQALTDPIIAEAQKRHDILLTPHIAFYTNKAVENMVQISLDDALAIVTHGHSEHDVN